MTEIEEEAYLNYAADYACALEGGILRLYHLCKDGNQDNGTEAWELLQELARTASQNDLRGYITGLDGGMSAARAVMLRAANKLN